MKKHSTLERLDLGREIRILALGLIGSLIMAINIKSFVHTGGLYPGGFNGVTLLIQTSFQRFLGISLPFSPISLALNAIPAIFSFRAIGKRFTLNTALIIVATSVFTDIVPAMPITQDILLISVFGGLINGAAISLCLIGGTSTGGTDFIAVYFLEKKNRDVWNFILMGNATVLVLAGLLFGWDKALYSIIFQFTSTQMIHLLYQEHNKITLFIVTELPYEDLSGNHGNGASQCNGNFGDGNVFAGAENHALLCSFQHRGQDRYPQDPGSGSEGFDQCDKDGNVQRKISSDEALLNVQSIV